MENQSCGILIKQLHTTLERKANQELQQYGMTTAQVSMLLELRKASENRLPLKQLEKRLHLAQSTTAGLAYRLEQKGLVSYEEDKEDRRVKFIALTDSGRICCEAVEGKISEAEEDLLSCLTETEKEIFLSLLNKVAQSL